MDGSGNNVNRDRAPRFPTRMDSDEFVDFYTRELDGQVRRAYLMLGDAEAAHDVVATAFTAMYRRWGEVNEPGPYLNRCVLNACRDAARKTGREHLTARPEPSHGERDEVDELGDLLVTLPFRQRAAIVLRFYGGYSEDEIAETLACRPGTVGSLIHRGLNALRHKLSPEENTK